MSPRVTPWRDDDEWNSVKLWFFCRDHGNVDTRLQALGRVRAWTIRGRVPHAVTSTAMLTAAVMRDQPGDPNYMEARMLIAMALTRFVNGLLDPAQQAVFAISMTSLAKSIGLPEAFVEIRHSATHDSLPSLPVLRSALSRALDWLWHHYWNAEPRAQKREHLVEDKGILFEKCSSILKTWRKLRKSDPSRAIKSGDADPVTKQSITLLRELKSIKDGPVVVDILSETLLSPKNLLSTTSGSFLLWHPLLDCAFDHYKELQNSIILYGISVLGSAEVVVNAGIPVQQDLSSVPLFHNKIPDINGSYNRLQSWLLRLISTGNPDSRSTLDKNSIVKALALATDPYTLQIMQEIHTVPGYEKVSRLLAIRTTQEQVKTNSPSEDKFTEKSFTASYEDELKHAKLVIERSSIWSKTYAGAQPIGYLVS